MKVSVVIPTLNGRDQLAACLDAMTATAPGVEVIVVNGPSADGTTGMVRDRDDVDVLVEVSDRTVNVARNAGIEVATGDVIAFVDFDRQVGETWLEGLKNGLKRAPVVTGPTHRAIRAGHTTEEHEERTVAGRRVSYFDGGNVAFNAGLLRELDGFDEYLATGGARDAAHRLAGMGHRVAWVPEMCVTEAQDGADSETDWGWKYRGLAYRLVKNYGIRPRVVTSTLSHAARDSLTVARDVFGGDARPTTWIGNGRDVLTGIVTGGSDGLVARARDRSSSRNPHGLSTRADRAVARYDWRQEGAGFDGDPDEGSGDSDGRRDVDRPEPSDSS